MRIDEDISALYARLDDLAMSADKGEVARSAFLSPRELHYAQGYLSARGESFFAFGGYCDAERKRIYILPDYMEGVDSPEGLVEYGFDTDISCVRVVPSGYRALTHRDFLGSTLGLGIERTVIGDILVGSDGKADVICDGALADFLAENLCKVANDKVRTSVITLADIEAPERRFAEINDTVASPRLDCIVGALCSLSREKARSAVEAGIVEVNFEGEERPDRDVSAPCTVSVRGYGRYDVLSVSDKTKKGRYRLLAKKYL